jgi:hypothetical protein
VKDVKKIIVPNTLKSIIARLKKQAAKFVKVPFRDKDYPDGV